MTLYIMLNYVKAHLQALFAPSVPSSVAKLYSHQEN